MMRWPESRSWVATTAIATVLSLASASPAQAQSTADLDRARAKAVAGLASLEAKAYATALRECSEALRIVKAPPVRLCVARAFAGLDRLREAMDAYEGVTAHPVGSDEPESWKLAREAATQELAVTTKVVADRAEQLLRAGETALKGKDYVAARAKCEASEATMTSMSARLCAARARAQQERSREVVAAYEKALAPGAAAATWDDRERLRAEATTELEAARKKVAEQEEAARKRLAREEEVQAREASQTAWGWVLVGTGVAALGTAGGLASMVISTNDELSSVCSPDGVCGSYRQSTVQSLYDLRIATFVTLGAGAVATSAGIVRLATVDGSEPELEVGLWGPAGVQFRGRF